MVYLQKSLMLRKLIAFMPFDFAQESVRQAHHECYQQLTYRLEPA